MKKIIFSISLVLLGVSIAMAQDTDDLNRDKKGRYILPEAGDIAIGIEASPFLRYFGNFFNDTQNNASPNLLFKDGQTIYAKYFIDDAMALRLNLGVAAFNNIDRRYVRNDLAFFNDPLSRDQVVDRQTNSYANYELGLGLELRRGYNRLQGFYGGGVIFGWEQASTKYTYGNPISDIFPNPSTHNFGGNILPGFDRMLHYKDGNIFYTGLNAFLGVEYFILPKISIGGEFGLAATYGIQGVSKYTYEHYTGSAIEEKLQLVSPGDRDLGAFIVNPKGGIYIMFHF